MKRARGRGGQHMKMRARVKWSHVIEFKNDYQKVVSEGSKFSILNKILCTVYPCIKQWHYRGINCMAYEGWVKYCSRRCVG